MNLPQNLFDGDVSVQVILCQPDKTRIGEILPYDKNGMFRFNSYSEISFTIDRYYNDLITGETKINPYYDLIESPRIIELRGLGHFVIQDGDEEIGNIESKSVTAFSLEHSTGQKYLENFYVNTGEEGSVETMYHARTHGAEYAIDVYYKQATEWDKFERYYKKEYTSTDSYNYVEVQVFDENDFKDNYKGTDSENTLYVKAYPNVRFYWPKNPELSLLHLVMSRIPEWKIGHVDKELWYEERTFSEDRTAVYDFFYNIAAPTLKFVMVWDTVGDENTVSFYKAEEDGITTELRPASTYIDGIVYFDKDGSQSSKQPKNNDDVLYGDYYVKYDAIETQWATDVFISKDNLASQIDISYSADDIKTKLKITGADTLDVRDVNLGQNYITNLSYYNTDLWMGRDLHAKYDQYTKYLAEKTDEYSNLMSKWSAAYNEYSDLMNNVPVSPSVLMIGDKFDKLYCTHSFYNALTQDEINEMYELQDGGSVNLFNRPQIDSSKLIDVGWENAGSAVSTVFTTTYSNEDGTIAINVTPILPNGDVMSPDELEGYAGGLIHNEITDDLGLQIGSIFTGENAIVDAERDAKRIHELQEKYYLSPGISVTSLIKNLKTDLGLYRVGIDVNGNIAATDKSDDVLLTLTNDNSDSAVIRVRCTSKGDTYENYEYEVVRTLTNATTGYINTEKFTLKEWVEGSLTADYVAINGRKMSLKDFTVKSIGTLGAYLCLAKNEKIKDNVEDYGIKLLEEKQNTYTSIFIAQTEGYMSKEGSQCVASDTEPTGRITVGDKWLNTKDKNATVYVYVGTDGEHYEGRWNVYSTGDNSADFENYTRFLDNYDKLQVVQEVLTEKQRVADYLLNGVKMNDIYLTFDTTNPAYDSSYYLTGLLRAAILHHMTLNNYVISASQPSKDYEKEDMVWFQYNEYTAHITVYKWTIINENTSKWVPQNGNTDGFDFNAILTDYFEDKEKKYAYLTYIFDPIYTKATKFSDNYTYFIKGTREVDGVTLNAYNKFYAQPGNDSDVLNTYEGIINSGSTIKEGAVCYFTITDEESQSATQYVFTAPQDLDSQSILLCNTDTNKLIIGTTTMELIKYAEAEAVDDTANLSFSKVNYYIAEGLEYAVYTTGGTPYVSYSRSQGMCLAQMNYIKELTDMNNYFSEPELMRLSPFIREDEYADDNFLLTGYESEAEQMDIKKSLLKAGTEELAKICRPRLSFSATMANLLEIPEFAPLRWQFKLGNFVNVGIREPYDISNPDNVKKARLLEVQINFEDASDFSCTFGDLMSTKSQVDKHADLLSQAVTVAKQVATHASNWQKGANVATTLDQAINDGLKDAALSVGAANGQSIVWDQYGIKGRKLKDGSTTEYDDRQFALINNKLVFTDDNWATSKAAVGEFEVEIKGKKQNMYGMLADAIVGGYIQGTEIVGGKLTINGKKGTFIVNEDGDVQIKSSTGDDLYAQQSAVTAIDAAYKYSIKLIHTDKAVFSTKDDKATITAKVYRRGVDVTQIFKDEGVQVSWNKNPSDSNWAPSEYVDGEYTYGIILRSNDVQNSAQISCYINIDDAKIQEIEKKYFANEGE